MISFICSEPSRVFGEVGYDEVRSEGDDAGQDTFEDKDPAPSMVALDVVHFVDGGSEQAVKRICKLCGYEEESKSLLSLCSFVPPADQVETCSEVRVSRRIETSAVAFSLLTPREYSVFCESKEETGSNQATIPTH